MFKSKLEQFLAKRVLICFVVLSIIDIIIVKNRWLVLAGFTAGTALSLLKFGSNTLALGRIYSSNQETDPKKQGSISGVILLIVNQIMLLPMILMSYFLNRWVFWGLIAGILSVPFVIMLNSITEAIGITENHFE